MKSGLWNQPSSSMDPSVLQSLGLHGAAEDMVRTRRAARNIPYMTKPLDDGSLASAIALMNFHHDNEDDMAFEEVALSSLARSITSSSLEDQYNITLILCVFYFSREQPADSLSRKEEAVMMWQKDGHELRKVRILTNRGSPLVTVSF